MGHAAFVSYAITIEFSDWIIKGNVSTCDESLDSMITLKSNNNRNLINDIMDKARWGYTIYSWII